MSHCFGVLCSTHERIMEPASCPERGCDGHGFTYADCDDRCPDNAARSLRDHLAPATTGPGPEAHARLDQFLAEHNKLFKPAAVWAAENGIQWDD